VLRRGASVRVEVAEPSVDDQRLDLYRRWHMGREVERGWRPDRIGPESYAMQFCFPHAAAREFSYWEGETLLGIGIADQTPHALSAVYCYYEPSRSDLSLGTLNVLRAIEYARERGLAHVYLGYRVEGCASLQYKGRFQPQERLRGRIEGAAVPLWERE
jgi:arginine-tRNA-protein transferase